MQFKRFEAQFIVLSSGKFCTRNGRSLHLFSLVDYLTRVTWKFIFLPKGLRKCLTIRTSWGLSTFFFSLDTQRDPENRVDFYYFDVFLFKKCDCQSFCVKIDIFIVKHKLPLHSLLEELLEETYRCYRWL